LRRNYSYPPSAATNEPAGFRCSLGGDRRLFTDPPDIIIPANSEDNPTPEGINITFSKDSIPYGLSRILWWEGNWIEATTDLPFGSVGVQFLGDPQIG
jgi:hypothetical protein